MSLYTSIPIQTTTRLSVCTEKKLDGTETVPYLMVRKTVHYFGALLQKGTDSAYLFPTKIVPLYKTAPFFTFFCGENGALFFKGTKMVPL